MAIHTKYNNIEYPFWRLRSNNVWHYSKRLIVCFRSTVLNDQDTLRYLTQQTLKYQKQQSAHTKYFGQSKSQASTSRIHFWRIAISSYYLALLRNSEFFNGNTVNKNLLGFIVSIYQKPEIMRRLDEHKQVRLIAPSLSLLPSWRQMTEVTGHTSSERAVVMPILRTLIWFLFI